MQRKMGHKMVNLRDLFDNYDLPDTTEDCWVDAKDEIKLNIDLALDRGKVDQETLEIMKELLDICKPKVATMEDYIDEEGKSGR